jgi:hypothetical protein
MEAQMDIEQRVKTLVHVKNDAPTSGQQPGINFQKSIIFGGKYEKV